MAEHQKPLNEYVSHDTIPLVVAAEVQQGCSMCSSQLLDKRLVLRGSLNANGSYLGSCLMIWSTSMSVRRTLNGFCTRSFYATAASSSAISSTARKTRIASSDCQMRKMSLSVFLSGGSTAE